MNHTGLSAVDAETVLSIMKHKAEDSAVYEQSIIDGYVSAGGTAADGASLAARVLQEAGQYVSDGPGDPLVPVNVFNDHAILVTDVAAARHSLKSGVISIEALRL